MKIPKKIKILGMVFDIKIEKDCRAEDNSLCAAYIQRDYGVIVLEEGLHPDRMGQALFHEILHAVDIRGELDEEQTDQFAHSLYQVFKDNKLLKDA